MCTREHGHLTSAKPSRAAAANRGPGVRNDDPQSLAPVSIEVHQPLVQCSWSSLPELHPSDEAVRDVVRTPWRARRAPERLLPTAGASRVSMLAHPLSPPQPLCRGGSTLTREAKMKPGSMQAATTSERYWRKWWRSRLFVALILTATIWSAGSLASETAGRYARLLPEISAEQQIELAMSAAPSHISRRATIYVLGPNGYVQDRIGSNGFSCLVERQYLGTLEPSCYDAEGSATTLRARLYREELRAAKMSEEEIEKKINEGYTTGAFRAPTKPGLVYMLSPHNQVHND